MLTSSGGWWWREGLFPQQSNRFGKGDFDLFKGDLGIVETGGEVAHLDGFLACVDEVCTGAFRAANTFGTEDFAAHDGDVAALLHQFGIQPDVWPQCADGLPVPHLHLGRHAGSLQLVEDHPTANLVQ